MSSCCWRKAELSVVFSSFEFESESASWDNDSAAAAWNFLDRPYRLNLKEMSLL